MEKGVDIYKFISKELVSGSIDLSNQDICSYSPLTLAYIGDAVYELVIRSMIVTEGNAPVNKLHKKSSELVKAGTQSKMALYFVEKEMLSEEELRVLKRGRNAQSYTKAKNASISEYRWATGYEALMGYLYLSGKSDRMISLIATGLQDVVFNETSASS